MKEENRWIYFTARNKKVKVYVIAVETMILLAIAKKKKKSTSNKIYVFLKFYLNCYINVNKFFGFSSNFFLGFS